SVIAASATSSLILKGKNLDAEVLFTTAIALVATMTVFMGTSFYLLGKFKLGKIIEYTPYPVIAGFLAGTGALIIIGGIEISTGLSFFEGEIRGIFEPNLMALWVPEVTYAILMVIILEKMKNIFLLPVMLLTAMVAFYGIIWFLGVSIEEASLRGMLLGPFPEFSFEDLAVLANVDNIQWYLIFDQLPDYFIAACLGVIALLFKTNSLEVISNTDIDINHELKVTGTANILAGCVGGIGGYPQLATSVINQKMGAKTYLSGISRTITIALLAIVGLPLLGVMPKSLFVILLIFLGIYFLYDWLYQTYFKISKYEYFSIPIIACTIVVSGLLVGVLTGVVISLVMFAFRYSSIKIIKSELSGEACSSNIERDYAKKQVLQGHRRDIRLIYLQSYIFFGNSVSLVDKVIEDIKSEEIPIKYLILDFKNVFSADVSTIFSFIKISRYCVNHSVKLIFSELPQQLKLEFEVAKKSQLPLQYQEVSDVDHALELCESDILEVYKDDLGPTEENIKKLLPNLFKHEAFFKYFEKLLVPKDTIIMSEGAESESLFIIAKGKVEVFITDVKGISRRMKLLSSGTIIGEVGLMMNTPRTASVRAVEDCELLKLTRDNLEKLKKEHPIGLADLYLDIASITMERFISVSESYRQLNA
ncbi:MAG: SulP family inorganic anion transporter, partial [Chlamydiota bacterium]